jgi:sporulation protein YhbH
VPAVFRPKREAPVDRSAGDRLRHRQKVRSSIRDNIADIIAEESIIGRSGDRVIKVPIRGIKEYRFVYGDNAPGVGEGAGDETQRGDVVGRKRKPGRGQPGEAGEQAGVDYYETDVTLDELIDIMFEDLDLPDLERKQLDAIESLRLSKRKGYRQVGLRVRLDRRRTVMSKLRRVRTMRRARAGSGASATAIASSGGRGDDRVPFHLQDLTYRHRTTEIHRESNAVVICIMDTSGSMDTTKKYLARSFFFLLYQFVSRRYENVEVVFIAHDIEAKEVTEEEFFHKGEAGGTFVSSGYRKALDVITDRYHPELWNIYTFHCSDGDNFGSDTPAAIAAAKELCEVTNLFGYGEIKPRGAGYYGSSLLETFRKIDASNFQTVLIERKEDVWPSFKAFLSKEERQRVE